MRTTIWSGKIRTIITETKIDRSCLKWEITESVVMENADNAISMFSKYAISACD
ncbi:MAG: hypothetical protein ABIU09_12180 [Pyrinomonadaceae bacterium]